MLLVRLIHKAGKHQESPKGFEYQFSEDIDHRVEDYPYRQISKSCKRR